MTKKQELVNKFEELALKLGKLPTIADLRAYSITRNMIKHHFGNHTNLKNEALTKNPSLEQLNTVGALYVEDVTKLRNFVEQKQIKAQRENLVKSVNTLDYIAEFSEKVFKGRIKPNKPNTKKIKIKRDLHAIFSDHHYGSDLNKEEHGIEYGKVEESRRVAAVVKEIVNYKLDYRNETRLILHLIGDMIENKLHDPQDAAPLSEQVCRAIHILSQAIAQFGENFGEVLVVCSTGNHGRTLSRHEKRASSGKWDSVETVIYYAVKNALSNYKNVKFDIPKTPYVVVDSLGYKMFSTHGDTVLKPGNPGKSINVKSLQEQVNRINASLLDKHEYKVFIMGHVHTGSVTQLNNGALVITNGPLCPPNGFANSIGILEGVCSQIMFETVKGHPVGDIRFIRVGENEDRDSSLDKIIKPWCGFNG